ncbi:MAG: DNA-formamidopyrimidine glycosylase family protein [Catalinimonas sp.]
MPELPEVETYRRYFDEVALHLPIADVYVEEGYETRLRVPADALRAALVGRTFVGSERVGKYLFARTDAGAVFVMHFGMTGRLQYFRGEPDGEEAPRFARFQIGFENGYRLALRDPRKFARLDLTDDLTAYRKQRKLGPDALTMTADDLRATLRGKRTMIKPALLDQRVAAGVGNWIVDEVLFQAYVHPETRVYDLPNDRIVAIQAALRRVLEVAIAHEAHYATFPEGYLIKNRWVKDHARDGGAYTCPRCASPIVYARVGGRGTFLCEGCQGQGEAETKAVSRVGKGLH